MPVNESLAAIDYIEVSCYMAIWSRENELIVSIYRFNDVQSQWRIQSKCDFGPTPHSLARPRFAIDI